MLCILMYFNELSFDVDSFCTVTGGVRVDPSGPASNISLLYELECFSTALKCVSILFDFIDSCLQCIDTIGWAPGRASGL